MVKIFGICILLFAFIILSNEHSKKKKHSLEVCEEMLSLLHYIRRQLSCFLCPIKTIAAQFHAETEEVKAFLLKVAEGEAPSDSYAASGISGAAGNEVDRILSSFFVEFGEGYAQGELHRIDAAAGELSALVDKDRVETVRSIRLFKTVGSAVCFGLIILLI